MGVNPRSDQELLSVVQCSAAVIQSQVRFIPMIWISKPPLSAIPGGSSNIVRIRFCQQGPTPSTNFHPPMVSIHPVHESSPDGPDCHAFETRALDCRQQPLHDEQSQSVLPISRPNAPWHCKYLRVRTYEHLCCLYSARALYITGSPAAQPCPYGINAEAAKRKFTVFLHPSPPNRPEGGRSPSSGSHAHASMQASALWESLRHRGAEAPRVFRYAKHFQRHPGCRESSMPPIDQEIVRSRNCWGRGTSPCPTPLSHTHVNAHARTHNPRSTTPKVGNHLMHATTRHNQPLETSSKKDPALHPKKNSNRQKQRIHA